MAPDSRQLSAISRIFSSAVFREMAKKGRSATFARLFELSGVRSICDPQATVAQGFDTAFSMLKRVGWRDEYVYRAAITQKLLMGTHSLNTASMLTEFRAVTSKADVVVLNGTASVYEIKSERDSLVRLEGQIANYKKVFASVNVIASEDHVDAVLSAIPDDVGVMCLSSRFRIRTIRPAVDDPKRVCPLAIFDSLRMAEAADVLRSLGSPVPVTPNTQRHAAMRRMFALQEPAPLHAAMVSVLKKTRDLSTLRDLVEMLPDSLHTAALSIRVKPSEYERLIHAVSTPLADAVKWS